MNHHSFGSSVEQGSERAERKRLFGPYDGHTPDWYEQGFRARKRDKRCAVANLWYALATFAALSMKKARRAA